MSNFTKAEARKALQTLSSLKRALGIANHPTRTDESIGNFFHIYTPDEQSGQLIGELLHRYHDRPEFLKTFPQGGEIVRATVRVTPLEEGGYDASLPVTNATHFAKWMQKMLDTYIAPDHRSR